jgi:uncharacterized protein YecT (DUF1311 family)
MRRLALLFLLLVSSPAHPAEERNCDPNAGLVDGACLMKKEVYDPCQGPGALDFGECARRVHEKADAELNRIYQQLMAILPDTGTRGGLTKAKLREDQTKWLRWKDSYCMAVGDKTGGVQMWKSAYTAECWARATEDQARKLRRLLRMARPTSHSPER